MITSLSLRAILTRVSPQLASGSGLSPVVPKVCTVRDFIFFQLANSKFHSPTQNIDARNSRYNAIGRDRNDNPIHVEVNLYTASTDNAYVRPVNVCVILALFHYFRCSSIVLGLQPFVILVFRLFRR